MSTQEIDRRGRQAAAALREAVPGAPPELSDLVGAARLRRLGRIAFSVAVLVVVGAVAFAIASVATPASLGWVTAGILLVLLAAVWLLCAHAGGHAWFVPLPAVALAALWALSLGGHDRAAAWWLVALCATAAACGVGVGSAVLRQRLRTITTGPPALEGAEGIVVTTMAPIGIVKVAGENWTARSLSGTLPAGAPVHVVRADGVRLDVWSEAGTVPGPDVLESKLATSDELRSEDDKEQP